MPDSSPPDATNPTPSPQFLIHVRDLIFSSKITATARAQGVSFKAIRDAAVLLETSAPRLLIDLNDADRLATAIAWKKRHGGHVTGFASHVATDTLAAAREGGIDRVMSNGGFTAQLPAIVRGEAAD